MRSHQSVWTTLPNIARVVALASIMLLWQATEILCSNSDLLKASQAGDLKAVERSLEAGAEPAAAVDENGNNALHWASWHGHAEIVSKLLESGAVVDKTDGPNDGNTALMKAAWNAHHERFVDTIKVLLDNGANIEAKNVYGMTALMNAAMSGYLGAVEALIHRGADPKVGDQGGVTALHKAAYRGHNDICLALIEGGADVNQARHDGITPIMLAESEKKLVTVSLLKTKGAETPKMERMTDL